MNVQFQSITQGLKEAIKFAKGNGLEAKVHAFTSLDIKQIRARVGMTQPQFANAFGISVATLRHWA